MKKTIIWNKKQPVENFVPAQNGFDGILNKHIGYIQGVARVRRTNTILGIVASLIGVTIIAALFYSNSKVDSLKSLLPTATLIDTPNVLVQHSIEIPDASVMKKVIENGQLDRKAKNSFKNSKTVAYLTVDKRKNATPENHKLKDAHKPLTTFTEAFPINGYQTFYVYLNTQIDSLLLIQNIAMSQKIHIIFEINQQGNAHEIAINDLQNTSLKNGLIEIVKAIPSWQPATANGLPISSKFSLPMTLSFQKKQIETSPDK